MTEKQTGTMPCDNCIEHQPQEFVVAKYALSLSKSDSAANITFVCGDCLKPQLDFMLSVGLGSVDVQSLTVKQLEIVKT